MKAGLSPPPTADEMGKAAGSSTIRRVETESPFNTRFRRAAEPPSTSSLEARP